MADLTELQVLLDTAAKNLEAAQWQVTELKRLIEEKQEEINVIQHSGSSSDPDSGG